jgi:ubiquinone/menaquinone biosynthesis C-methylase UbiE
MSDDGGVVLSPAQKYEQFFVPAMFAPFARSLVDWAGLDPGQHVLDLACGTGIVARLAAPRVSESGRVVAMDLRQGMLDAARTIAPPQGATIEWVQGDATDPGIPDAMFDHVICHAGLMFFPDRPRALAEARRMLKPGGRLSLQVWQDLGKQTLFHAMARYEFAHLQPLAVTWDDFNQPFSLGDAAELRSLLEGAGFREIEIRQEVRDARFPDPDSFVQNMEYAYSAVIPEFAANPALFDRFVEAVARDTKEIVQSYRVGEEIVFPLHAHMATAKR